jgi:hypothetical protein
LFLDGRRTFVVSADKPVDVTASTSEQPAQPATPAPETPKDRPKETPWYLRRWFLGGLAVLLIGPTVLQQIRLFVRSRYLEAPELAPFPKPVREPLLNATTLEASGRPADAAFWYYTALTKALEVGMDPFSELITALIIRWANLETSLGRPNKAMELYENMFWQLVKGPSGQEEDGTWKVEPKEDRYSRLDRAALLGLYCAGTVEALDEGASEREVYERALLWNRRVVNAFLAKTGSEATITLETMDGDLEWVEDLAPSVGEIAGINFVKVMEDDIRRRAAELAAQQSGAEAPAAPATADGPQSPLLPFLRPSKNRQILVTAFNNLSEYIFVLETALRPGAKKERPSDFPEIPAEELLRALSYRIHGVLLDLDGLPDPCGLAVQLTGIVETYANAGKIGAHR